MRRRLPPAPPKLPDDMVYDIDPGSNLVVPEELIRAECRSALRQYDRNLRRGILDWDHYKKDPAYWWRKK